MTISDWLSFPQQHLLQFTGGVSFSNSLGHYEHAKKILLWYPNDIWRWIMASQWYLILSTERLIFRTDEAGDFPRFCDRTRFNRTRRNLHAVIEEIRKELSKLTGYAQQPYRIIDSIPIPVCKFGRAHFHKTFRGFGATYGKCPSKKETYLGYKLHMLVTLDGFVTDFDITPANIDDREGVWDLVDAYQRIVLIGDKGYIGNILATDLKDEKVIDLLPVKKRNSKV